MISIQTFKLQGDACFVVHRCCCGILTLLSQAFPPNRGSQDEPYEKVLRRVFPESADGEILNGAPKTSYVTKCIKG